MLVLDIDRIYKCCSWFRDCYTSHLSRTPAQNTHLIHTIVAESYQPHFRALALASYRRSSRGSTQSGAASLTCALVASHLVHIYVHRRPYTHWQGCTEPLSRGSNPALSKRQPTKLHIARTQKLALLQIINMLPLIAAAHMTFSEPSQHRINQLAWLVTWSDLQTQNIWVNKYRYIWLTNT